MSARVNLLEVALKKDIGIDLTNDEIAVYSSYDEECQNDFLEFIRSSDYASSIMPMIVQLVRNTKEEDKEIVSSKCIVWLEKFNTSEKNKSNIKNLIKSC